MQKPHASKQWLELFGTVTELITQFLNVYKSIDIHECQEHANNTLKEVVTYRVYNHI